jgi:hypothetical protein
MFKTTWKFLKSGWLLLLGLAFVNYGLIYVLRAEDIKPISYYFIFIYFFLSGVMCAMMGELLYKIQITNVLSKYTNAQQTTIPKKKVTRYGK